MGIKLSYTILSEKAKITFPLVASVIREVIWGLQFICRVQASQPFTVIPNVNFIFINIRFPPRQKALGLFWILFFKNSYIDVVTSFPRLSFPLGIFTCLLHLYMLFSVYVPPASHLHNQNNSLNHMNYLQIQIDTHKLRHILYQLA